MSALDAISSPSRSRGVAFTSGTRGQAPPQPGVEMQRMKLAIGKQCLFRSKTVSKLSPNLTKTFFVRVRQIRLVFRRNQPVRRSSC